MRRLDVREVLSRSLGRIESDIARKRIRLNQQLESSNSFVIGGAARLQQIFDNLLENAIRHTPAEGEIVVRLENEAEMLRSRLPIQAAG